MCVCVCECVCMCVCARKKPNLLKRYYHQRTICISLYKLFSLAMMILLFLPQLLCWLSDKKKRGKGNEGRKISRKKREEETPGGEGGDKRKQKNLIVPLEKRKGYSKYWI